MKIKITPKSLSQQTAPTVISPFLGVRVPNRPLRILDFDVEARPLHWISGDYVSKEITAIAWAWIRPNPVVSCYLLGESTAHDMLAAFVAAYKQADLVTGHYIRGYDLPMVNGALSEYGLPILDDKMVQDTKIDLVRRAGLSGSQENLGAMLGLHHPKIKMDQTKWRNANRLTPEGVALARERVVGDVLQHIEMRQRLLDLGYLCPPTLWSSGNPHQPEAAYAP